MLKLFEKLEALDRSAQRRVYTRLWFELTIAGRAIGFDSDLNEDAKLSCLRWLNEIQHCTWGAFADPEGRSPRDLERIIRSHIEEARELDPYVGIAFRRAVEHGASDDAV